MTKIRRKSLNLELDCSFDYKMLHQKEASQSTKPTRPPKITLSFSFEHDMPLGVTWGGRRGIIILVFLCLQLPLGRHLRFDTSFHVKLRILGLNRGSSPIIKPVSKKKTGFYSTRKRRTGDGRTLIFLNVQPRRK